MIVSSLLLWSVSLVLLVTPPSQGASHRTPPRGHSSSSLWRTLRQASPPRCAVDMFSCRCAPSRVCACRVVVAPAVRDFPVAAWHPQAAQRPALAPSSSLGPRACHLAFRVWLLLFAIAPQLAPAPLLQSCLREDWALPCAPIESYITVGMRVLYAQHLLRTNRSLTRVFE